MKRATTSIDEWLKRAERKRKKPVYKPQSQCYDLGFLMGELIYDRYLPTLDVDGWQTRKVITVSDEEKAEYKRLSDEWYNTNNHGNNDSTKEWVEYRKYAISLKEKYIPQKLKCFLPYIHIKNMLDFKRGLGASLWGCDVCNYEIGIDDIEVKEENVVFKSNLIITLKTDIDKDRQDLYDNYEYKLEKK